MKRMLACCMLLLLASLLGSCGFKDIDKRFFVVGFGLDLSGNEQKPYRMTIKLAIPSPKIEPDSSKAQFETIDASSISEGLRMLKAYVDKELDFGHCKMFLAGSKLAQQDINLMKQWMLRRRDIQNVAYIAIGYPNARAVLQVKPISERYPGNALLLAFGPDGTESSYTYSESLSGFARRMTEKGLDPVLAIVREDGKNGYIINETALFDKQKIRLKLSPDETQLLNQLLHHYRNSSAHGIFKSDNHVVAIDSMRTKFHFRKYNDQTVVSMKIRMRVVTEEAPATVFQSDWPTLEKELAESYRQSILKLLDKIRKAGVDPFGFGLRYLATHPGSASWEEWQRIYPEIGFDAQVTLKIEATGLFK